MKLVDVVEIGQTEAHVAREELAAYVMDTLGGGRKDAIELHVFACEVCSESLAREARLEAAFEAVARRASDGAVVSIAAMRSEKSDLRARQARQHRWMGGVAGALAAAAAVVLALASTTKSEQGGLGVRARAWDDAAEGAPEGALRATLAESGFVEGTHDNLDGG